MNKEKMYKSATPIQLMMALLLGKKNNICAATFLQLHKQ
jgi:hypothetical protein